MVPAAPTPSQASLLAPRPTLRTVLLIAAVGLVGLLVAAVHAALIDDGWRRFMLAYLVAFAFVLSLSLGALFFVIVQHLTRAGWSVVVRRPAEVLAANLTVIALLFLPVALSVARGGGELYPWAQPASAAVLVQHEPRPLLSDDGSPADERQDQPYVVPTGYEHQQLDAFTLSKRPYLNRPFFLLRWVLLLALWVGMGLYFWRLSVRQDTEADDRLTLRMERFAGPAAVLLGLSATFASFDLLMSLNPHWYSTIFGVYFFSGAAVGALAALILIVAGLRRLGLLPMPVGQKQITDLGRLLFAFVFFWAYIAFSQYMLLWYANVPEMTAWLYIRGAATVPGAANAWSGVLLVLLFGHFLLPWLGLMSRHCKQGWVLSAWAAWLLAMHWLDLLWVVMPQWGPGLALGGIELGLLVAVVAVYLLGALYWAAGQSTVPAGDPRFGESLVHEPAY